MKIVKLVDQMIGVGSRLAFVLFFLLCSQFKTQAQIQLRPLPESGFELRITAYVNQMELVDTHEHIMPWESVEKSMPLDFMLLLHHYADDDIKSAGMDKPQFAELLTDKYSVMEKWVIIKPYWEASKNTAYGRVVLLSINELYGIGDLTDETVQEISDRIKASYKDPSWYDYVLKEKANIKYAILDEDAYRMEDKMFVNVEKFDQFIRIFSKDDLNAIGKAYDLKITSLDVYERALEKAFAEAVKRGIVGVKTALAYHRILKYENTTKADAQAVFTKMSQSAGPLSFEEAKPLQDYMMHRIIAQLRKYDLPMQIHTGLQAGDGNYISNSNPALLANLFLEYRDVRFSVFHGSYPYGGELAAMAKGFRHVYLDMSWLYIISPSYAERYLHEWLETVPANKIMAFGGDYHNVENSYGHSLMARAVVAKVLVEKVRTGYLTESEAINIARMILRDNAIELFRLE